MSIELKNRRESYEQIKPKRDKRKNEILNVLTNGCPGGMTAEEIVQELYRTKKIPVPDMNFVRPRLTEMKETGQVKVVGRKRSSTGRKTSLWSVEKP